MNHPRKPLLGQGTCCPLLGGPLCWDYTVDDINPALPLVRNTKPSALVFRCHAVELGQEKARPKIDPNMLLQRLTRTLL